MNSSTSTRRPGRRKGAARPIASVFIIPILLSHFSLSVNAHDHDHPHNDNDSFWAAGRHWNNYQEWSQSPEFQSNIPLYYCGTAEEPTLLELEKSYQTTQDYLLKKQQQQEEQPPMSRQPVQPIRIPLKWHSIARDDGTGAATITQIINSVDHLNRAFAHPTKGGFFFEFDPTKDYTVSRNSFWHFSNDFDDTNFKAALRRGDCSTLNVYTTASFRGVFGWGTKAFRCDDDARCYARCATDTIDDGVVLRYDLVTGGSVEAYNEGDVLVHEVGHWLGLYHTFQGGCSLPGDFIQDTPAEEGPASTCEEERDSCRGKRDDPSGMDPIHNYMDISNDACMFEFTDGQFDWMMAQWDAYRAPPPTPSPTTAPTLPPVTNAPTFTVINQQKDAPEPKCGTVASQNGYGGVGGQSKDCGSRRLDSKPRRRLKGS